MRTPLFGLLLTLTIVAGCLSANDPERIFHFEGPAATGQPGWETLTFEAAFNWYETQQVVHAAVLVTNDQPTTDGQPTTRAWRIRSGTCDSPGGVVGQDSDTWYPNLNVGDDGSVRVEIAFYTVINPASPFHVELNASPTTATRIACINLTRVGN